MLLVLAALGIPSHVSFAEPPQKTGSGGFAVGANRIAGNEQHNTAMALQTYARFRKIAESELGIQLSAEKKAALIGRIESNAREARVSEDELVELTQYGITAGAKQGLGPVLIFENIANALLRMKK